MFPVALGVPHSFFLPKLGVGFGFHATEGARMQVPEAAVHEYYRPIPWQDDIRAPGEFPNMESIPVAKGVQQPSYGHLRAGIFALYL